jgi:hypothetical protein
MFTKVGNENEIHPIVKIKVHQIFEILSWNIDFLYQTQWEKRFSIEFIEGFKKSAAHKK